MKPAPKWFIERFRNSLDISSESIRAHLALLWASRREGRKRWETDEWMLDGDKSTKRLTSYGRKLKERRRRAASLSNASRRVNQRKAAVARRKRQKRNRRVA